VPKIIEPAGADAIVCMGDTLTHLAHPRGPSYPHHSRSRSALSGTSRDCAGLDTSS